VSATYPAGAKPVLTLTSNVSLKNYAVDLSAPAKATHVPKAELDYFLQPSRYVPTDGIVKETALKATVGATTDMEKARAVYAWVVDNTFRDPKVRGCGRGDIPAFRITSSTSPRVFISTPKPNESFQFIPVALAVKAAPASLLTIMEERQN
jgi:hypothetical protein